MAIILIVSRKDTPGANGGATTAIDTTGANLLVVLAAFYGGTTSTLTISDAKSNTWTALPLYGSSVPLGNGCHRMWYAKNATVGTGHTVTVSATGIYPVLTVYAVSGADPTAPLDVETGKPPVGGSSSSPITAGAVTPTVNGALVVCGFGGFNNLTNPVVDSGVTQTTTQNPVAGTCVSGGAGYKIQTTAAAINPSWSWTGPNDYVTAVIAVFKPTGAALETAQPVVILPC